MRSKKSALRSKNVNIQVRVASFLSRILGASIVLAAAFSAHLEASRAASFENSAAHVRIVGIDYLRDGGGKAIIRVAIDPGFHINANPASEKYLIPTSVNITSDTPSQIIYPPAVKFTPLFADSPIDVYEGNIEIVVDRSQQPGTTAHLSGTLTVQACTDKICLPPADMPLPAN